MYEMPKWYINTTLGTFYEYKSWYKVYRTHVMFFLWYKIVMHVKLTELPFNYFIIIFFSFIILPVWCYVFFIFIRLILRQFFSFIFKTEFVKHWSRAFAFFIYKLLLIICIIFYFFTLKSKRYTYVLIFHHFLFLLH